MFDDDEMDYDYPEKTADEARHDAIKLSSQMVSIIGASIRDGRDNLTEAWLRRSSASCARGIQSILDINTGDLLIALGHYIGADIGTEIMAYSDRMELTVTDENET